MMRRGSRSRQNELFGYALISPVLLYLAVFMLVPFLWAFWISFTDKTIGANTSFIGLKNFIDLLSDGKFKKGRVNTLYYTGGARSRENAAGLPWPWSSTRDTGPNFMRSALHSWTIPTWFHLYLEMDISDVGGLFNFVLMRLGLVHQQVPWLYDKSLAMVSIIVANIWRGTPFIGISILAGLQAIPADYYEAAKIDGANYFKSFTAITLPQIREVRTSSPPSSPRSGPSTISRSCGC